MAEGIVNFVLTKLADAAVKEVLRLYGVSGPVEKMGRVLRWAQAFLKDADKSRRLNERQKYWVKLVRDVTYDIEDVIDFYLSLELDAQERRALEGCCPKVKNTIKRWLRKPTKLPELHSLRNTIEEIEKRIDEIERSRDIWDVNSLGDNGGDVGIRRPKQIIVPDNDDPDVVGFDKDRDNIVQKLLDQDSRRLHVISIVAQGGAGKTTLAKKVYNSPDIRRNFGFHLWITVSQSFELLNIIRSIAEQLKIEPPPSLEGHHLNDLYECLNGKRYIIVLDDVWSENLWAELRKVLPNNNGSRVLMTSRFEDVATMVDAAHIVHHLEPLPHELCLELFLKKALPQNPSEYYTNNLSEISELFVKICGGLPLALVVLGGILSNEEPTHDAWERVLKRISQHGVGNKVSEVLASSYDYLPFALKSCFMYFAIFPEDYEIEALPLQRMWIAEGLIPQEDGSTLEDTAGDFLEDLAKRNMIQVLQRGVCDGSITFFGMHDFLREVAIKNAHDENFLTLCSNTDEQNFSEARRIAVHQSNCDELMERTNPNLRSLFFSECIPNCSSHRNIKVICDMRNPFVCTDEIKIIGFERFTHLRYARFYSKVLDFENCIGRMRNLQTLEFLYFEHAVDLPDCFWNIKTLRHVIFPCISGAGSLGPPPKISLKNLQTLLGIRNRESWARGNLPNLPNLRTLSIAMTERLQIEVIVEFLCTLKKLDDLVVTGRDLLIDTSEFPFCANLTKFGYFGIGGSFQATDSSLFLINVTQLILGDLKIQQHHIAVLEKLAKLIFLVFSDIQFVGGKIMFSTEGFPCLRGLQFNFSNNVEELHIEKGAMPVLQQLRVMYCDNLKLPQGLKYLTKLNTVYWHAYPEKATTTVEEIRQLCEHVPFIKTEGLPERRHC
ncbi:Nbs-lrr resistance protein [Rhynchospora pubera]|uniref:Nbs-lrr resistance protein n=1 Tax=Rhynchospora pubera TaxID=906938 RepID=A0AAV8GFE1_9POAL|nr:Nbs-lrr resistance protein [Rhynchospora pubera]